MVLSLDRWVGKVAVVTGASSGIGAAIAQILVENGLIVVGIARRVERIELIAKKNQEKKGKLHAYKCDMSKEEEIIAAFKWVQETLGPVHVLINNAGLSRDTTLIDGDIEIWKQILNVNVLGLCIATREAVRIMRANEINGHIIHINSVAGHYVPAIPTFNVYPASKHAVTALTETLRQELNLIASKIKITSISPGLVESELTTLATHLSGDKMEAVLNLPILSSTDIADGVVYVLSTPEHVQVQELTIRPVGEPF